MQLKKFENNVSKISKLNEVEGRIRRNQYIEIYKNNTLIHKLKVKYANDIKFLTETTIIVTDSEGIVLIHNLNDNTSIKINTRITDNIITIIDSNTISFIKKRGKTNYFVIYYIDKEKETFIKKIQGEPIKYIDSKTDFAVFSSDYENIYFSIINKKNKTVLSYHLLQEENFDTFLNVMTIAYDFKTKLFASNNSNNEITIFDKNSTNFVIRIDNSDLILNMFWIENGEKFIVMSVTNIYVYDKNFNIVDTIDNKYSPFVRYDYNDSIIWVHDFFEI